MENNVVLLGDATHSPLSTSEQGACQAFGELLAREYE